MIFVFIGGGSASGKTGASEHLLKKLNEAGVSTQKLNMDDYYLERPDHVDPEEFRLHTNFDTPKMLHLDLFQEHVLALSTGKPIRKPLFSFLTNKRSGEEEIPSSEVIIVEGIFAQYFYQKYMPAELHALNVNVSTDSYSDIVERRIARDIATRGRTRAEVIAQEHLYVGPGFFQYTASHATGSDVYISNKKHSEKAEQEKELDKVADEIIGALSKRKDSIAASSSFVRVTKPDVRKVVARSHFTGGYCVDNMFTGYFGGVFGGIKGTYQEVFAEEEEPVSTMGM